MKSTVIFHRADYDGIFCREIARKFLPPDIEFIGWDYGDPKLEFPREGQVYVLDLSPECFWESPLRAEFIGRLIWIDHHKSAIDKYDGLPWTHEPAGTDSFGVHYNEFWRRGHETRTDPPSPAIAGYRIDGVAACRLVWQWFTNERTRGEGREISKQEFIDREVSEPLAVRLAGEYDVWDHRDNDADVAFQFGLDSQSELEWIALLAPPRVAVSSNATRGETAEDYVYKIIADGRAAMRCYAKRDADVMRTRSFLMDFEGLKFLALNTARCNSNTFNARDNANTGHHALLAFYWNGEKWSVSMYHAAHRKDLDLSLIAVKHGGGGHRGACGFTAAKLPWIPC